MDSFCNSYLVTSGPGLVIRHQIIGVPGLFKPTSLETTAVQVVLNISFDRNWRWWCIGQLSWCFPASLEKFMGRSTYRSGIVCGFQPEWRAFFGRSHVWLDLLRYSRYITTLCLIPFIRAPSIISSEKHTGVVKNGSPPDLCRQPIETQARERKLLQRAPVMAQSCIHNFERLFMDSFCCRKALHYCRVIHLSQVAPWIRRRIRNSQVVGCHSTHLVDTYLMYVQSETIKG